MDVIFELENDVFLEENYHTCIMSPSYSAPRKRNLYVPGSGKAFSGRLDFELTLIAHEGSDRWVEGVLCDAHTCLESDSEPVPDTNCDYCAYLDAAKGVSR